MGGWGWRKKIWPNKGERFAKGGKWGGGGKNQRLVFLKKELIDSGSKLMCLKKNTHTNPYKLRRELLTDPEDLKEKAGLRGADRC